MKHPSLNTENTAIAPRAKQPEPLFCGFGECAAQVACTGPCRLKSRVGAGQATDELDDGLSLEEFGYIAGAALVGLIFAVFTGALIYMVS